MATGGRTSRLQPPQAGSHSAELWAGPFWPALSVRSPFPACVCAAAQRCPIAMPLTTEDLTLPALRGRYAAGGTPTALCGELLPALGASRAIFISRPSDEEVLERCRWAGQGKLAAAHCRPRGWCHGRRCTSGLNRRAGRRCTQAPCRALAAVACHRTLFSGTRLALLPARALTPLLPRRPAPRAAGRSRRSPPTSGGRSGACHLR